MGSQRAPQGYEVGSRAHLPKLEAEQSLPQPSQMLQDMSVKGGKQLAVPYLPQPLHLSKRGGDGSGQAAELPAGGHGATCLTADDSARLLRGQAILQPLPCHGNTSR